MGSGMRGIQYQYALISGDGFTDPALDFQRIGKIVMRFGKFRFDGDCLVQCLDGGIEAAEFVQHDAATVVGIGLGGIERYSLVVFRQGFFILADGFQHDAQVAVGVSIGGIQCDSLPVQKDCLFAIALCLHREAQVVVEGRLVAIDQDGHGYQFCRIGKPANLIGKHAEQVVGFGVVRLDFQYQAVQLLRFTQLAGPVQLAGLRQGCLGCGLVGCHRLR